MREIVGLILIAALLWWVFDGMFFTSNKAKRNDTSPWDFGG